MTSISLMFEMDSGLSSQGLLQDGGKFLTERGYLNVHAVAGMLLQRSEKLKVLRRNLAKEVV